MNIESVASSAGAHSTGVTESSSAARRPAPTEAGRPAAGSGNGISVNASPDRPTSDEPSLNIEEAVRQLNKFVSSIRPEINFSVDEESGVRVIRVVDHSTKEVIRQIPSEEVIRMAQALGKLQGLFVKETA